MTRLLDVMLGRRAVPQPIDALAVAESDGTAYMSTYSLPDTEKILPNFQAFATSAYCGNPIVFAVILRRLMMFTEATFKFRNLGDKHLFGDPALLKLEQPWPNGSAGELLARMEQDVSLAGNFFARDAGDRLERLRPDWVTIVSRISRDPLGRPFREVIGYYYDPVGDSERDPDYYTVDEVAHWSPIPDPLANFRGMSWLTPLLREVNADIRQAEFKDAYFENAATPNLIIKYAQRVPPERVKSIKDAIRGRHTGPNNAFSTMVLDEGADPMVVGSDMAAASFAELMQAGETRIAAAGGVPALIVGLQLGLTASKPGEYEDAMRHFADQTMRPLWRSACAALSKLVTVPAGAQLWYDTSDVSALQAGEAAIADTMQKQAAAANTWIMAGFNPDAVIQAVVSGDPSLLIGQHSGLTSVQMQPPAAGISPTDQSPPGGAPIDQPA